MNELAQAISTFKGGKYAFLRLYDVILDKTYSQVEITFLYPQTLERVDAETRKDIQSLCESLLNLNSALKVKFKKSYLEVGLLKKQIARFFAENYKSISSQLTEKQIEINLNGENVNICLHLAREVQASFNRLKADIALCEYLSGEFIANFVVTTLEDENFALSSEIPYVPIVATTKKTQRYEVTAIKKLFGKEIQPFPELIKNITSPKTSVILFGKLHGVQKKAFTIKNGKRKGEEKSYFIFDLNDGKQIPCVYFCPKSNESKCKALADGLNYLCLGDVKTGLDGKLTYYIRSMTLAQTKIPPEEIKEEDNFSSHKAVVAIEEYRDHEQSNIFTSAPCYKEPILSSDIVVYDLETTGLNPESDEIIEIGAIKIEKGKITKKFSTFVKPVNPISAEATRINHITNEMVATAPKIEDVIIDFYNFCDGCIISGYNNTDFDNKFLRKAGQKVGIKFNNPNLDVFLLARVSHLKTSNLKLTTVAAALGIDLKGAHRAYNDAFATAKVLLKLNEA